MGKAYTDRRLCAARCATASSHATVRAAVGKARELLPELPLFAGGKVLLRPHGVAGPGRAAAAGTGAALRNRRGAVSRRLFAVGPVTTLGSEAERQRPPMGGLLCRPALYSPELSGINNEITPEFGSHPLR